MSEYIAIVYCYRIVIYCILKQITCEEPVNEFLKRVPTCKTEEAFKILLTDIGNYLLTRINQPISPETIIQASINSSIKTKKLIEDDRELEYNMTRDNYYDLEKERFPYVVEEADKLGWKAK